LLRRPPADVVPAATPGSAAVIAPTPPAPSRHLPAALPAAGSDQVVREGSDPRDYVVGGVAIRDHRDGEVKPLDMTPNLHAPDSRRLAPTVVALITGKVKAALYQCANDIPREARGEQPKLEGQITVSIKAHVLTIDRAEAHVRDIVGAAVEPTQQCVEQRAKGLTVDTPEEADVAVYTISMSYLIP
jgi:hypothetical protein